MARKKTHEEYVEEIINKFGGVYIFHTEYKRSDLPFKVEHKLCGYTWNPTPSNLRSGSGKCPKCAGKMNRTPQEFREYVLEITNGEYSSVEDFKGNNYITTFMHNPCGYTFTAIPQIAQKGELGCRNCSGMLIHDKERVESLLEDKYGTEYTLLSKTVKNNRDPIIVRHNVCGEEFPTRSTDIIHQGKVCPHCKPPGSKGERKIDKYLKSINVEFTREFSFFDCRRINELRFDFAIYDENGKLDYLIEFDGKQHFEPVEFFGGQEGFELGQLRDDIKNKYCKDNNIKLLRIPYWDEDNVDSILNSYIEINRRKVVA
ncbi:hypothetical protein ABE073_03805 [Lederbergia citrisecunda]|uniref:hypothetical protein n=1 Tax=Lederbergia citrisecunda TaxID=2833583 RepID=UPI003D280937